MNDIAIRVENLSKKYRIGEVQEKYFSFRDTLSNIASAPFRRLSRTKRLPGSENSIWALKDVSFEVKHGEVVGIIGRNGAGKTTLLKILSQITWPTEGQAEIHGHICSLLEVGTGFHPELTGRENIFLNGAILGMKKNEINRKFDEIVSFAEVERFIDTPVKRYSSGMFVRLAFAVAAHLEPEILLVDEVLSVGDYQFQKKCLGKMDDVTKSGRTVLYVSHNMPSVLKLCHRVIFLHSGSIRMDGDSTTVVEAYIQTGTAETAEMVWPMESAPGNGIAKMKAIRVLNKDGEVSFEHFLSESIVLEMEFLCLRSGVRLDPSLHLYSVRGECVFATGPIEYNDINKKQREQGTYRARCIIPGQLLNEGQYRVSAFLVYNVNNILVRQDEIITFRVNDDGVSRGDYIGGIIGLIRPLLTWTVEPLENA